MNWRYGFLLCCAALIAMAGATVVDGREAPSNCCESGSACDGAEVCCPPDVVGRLPCGDDGPGYCQETCVRVAFTPGEK